MYSARIVIYTHTTCEKVPRYQRIENANAL